MSDYHIWKEYFIALAISLAFCVAIILMLMIKFQLYKDLRKSLKNFVFVFRWWVIGKMHCNTDHKHKLFYRALYKVFWGFIIISVALTLSTIIELIGGVV